MGRAAWFRQTNDEGLSREVVDLAVCRVRAPTCRKTDPGAPSVEGTLGGDSITTCVIAWPGTRLIKHHACSVVDLRRRSNTAGTPGRWYSSPSRMFYQWLSSRNTVAESPSTF